MPLARDEMTIGRREGNTIRLTERNVSRFHAKISKSEELVLIEDLGSFNGIKINGSKITGRVTLSQGDIVEIGDYHLGLQPADASGAQLKSLRSSNITDSLDEDDEFGSDTAQQAIQPNISAESESGQISKALGHSRVASEIQPAGPAVSLTAATEAVSVPAGGFLADPDSNFTPQGATKQLDSVSYADLTAQTRLVAINTVLAGSAYPLDGSEMSMGRTGENALIIEHRSVSRAHGKIVADGDKFRVQDLDSINGILLNGVETSDAILKSGDVIELGRVKLRYTPGGEVFTMTTAEIEEARRIDLTDSYDDEDDFGAVVAGPNKKVLLAAAAAGLLLLVGIFAMFSGGEDDDPKKDPDLVATQDDAQDSDAPSVEEKQGKTDDALIDDDVEPLTPEMVVVDALINADDLRTAQKKLKALEKKPIYEDDARLAGLRTKLDDSIYAKLLKETEDKLEQEDLQSAKKNLVVLSNMQPDSENTTNIAARIEALEGVVAAEKQAGADDAPPAPAPPVAAAPKKTRPKRTRSGKADTAGAAALLKQATSSFVLNQCSKAVSQAKQAGQKDPGVRYEYLWFSGKCALNRGQTSVARSALQDYVRLGSNPKKTSDARNTLSKISGG